MKLPLPESGVSRPRRLGTGRLRMTELRHSLRYSRFVGRAKLILPTAAGGLILVLAGWPLLSDSIGRLQTGKLRIEASQMRDLRMVNPRYTGVDKDQRPFMVTADSARESGTASSPGGDLIALASPKADILSKEGTWILVTGKTGMYQPDAHLLDLLGDVTLFHDKGYRFTTASARVDLATGTAEGRAAVTGKGPSGTLEAQGFRVLGRGDVVIFTGKSKLVMNSAHPGE